MEKPSLTISALSYVLVTKPPLSDRTIFKQSAFDPCQLMDDIEYEGTVKWGVTTSRSYLPKDNSADFAGSESILDWLRQFASKEEDDNTFLRGFLGRMLFSGDEVNKPVNVLSGGEKVRVMLSKLMLLKSNVLVLDDPTNHLDLESIQA